MRLGLPTGLVAIAFVLQSGIARGDDRPRARLTYASAPDVADCPSEREVRDAVAARLGYDAFDSTQQDATPTRDVMREVVITVKRKGPGIVGSFELRGPRPGQRELESSAGDCRGLVDTIVVAVAVAVDPSSLTRPSSPPEPAPPAPAPAPAAPPVPTPPPPPPSLPEPPPWRASAGPALFFGELPAPAVGMTVTVGRRLSFVSLDLEGLATLDASKRRAGYGTVSAALLGGAIVPCVHAGALFGCGALTVAALRGEGAGEAGIQSRRASQPYVAASVRGGYDLALTHALWLRGWVEAVVPVTRVGLQLASQDVWRTSSVAARVGIRLGISF